MKAIQGYLELFKGYARAFNMAEVNQHVDEIGQPLICSSIRIGLWNFLRWHFLSFFFFEPTGNHLLTLVVIKKLVAAPVGKV